MSLVETFKQVPPEFAHMADHDVADLMTTPVLTVAPDDSTRAVAGAMAREDIKSVVVISEDCAVEGIFTATDYMHLAVDGADPAATTVGDCMSTGVVTATPSEPAAAAAERMEANDISHLPVVGPDDQVTGMLTSTDLMPELTD
jgi:CBS domain-containing protein